jgi:hypothetical protein
MMGGVSPKTCWASYKYEIKFWYTVASCWIIYINYTVMHGSTNIKLSNFQFVIMWGNFSIQLYNFTSIFTASTSLTIHYSFKQQIPAASGDSRQQNYWCSTLRGEKKPSCVTHLLHAMFFGSVNFQHLFLHHSFRLVWPPSKYFPVQILK